jgi:hypothetical protein
MCGPENAHCGKARPALAFGRAWERGGDGAPEDLVGKHGGGTTSSYYFYMWRFGWVFFLIALIFSVLALFTSLFACFGRIGALLASLGTTTALVFYTIAVVLMTYVSPSSPPELPESFTPFFYKGSEESAE